MKIDVNQIRHGLVVTKDDVIKEQLFYHLLKVAYPDIPRLYTRLVYNPFNLAQMCKILRSQDWCAYHWRDVHGVVTTDYNTYMNYGKREGIIIGKYCANLTAWLLTNL